MSTIEKAIIIAANAHAGQVDKAGQPYIYHPLRVMMSLDTPEEKMAAVLHDVIEDSELTLEDLRVSGFSEQVIQAVESVTKREGENYEDFVERASHNAIGKKVKLADLKDNCDLSRIKQPGEEDFRRIEKYKKAIGVLLA